MAPPGVFYEVRFPMAVPRTGAERSTIDDSEGISRQQHGMLYSIRRPRAHCSR